MARPNSSGLPFLVRRNDSGKFSYWRNFRPELMRFVRGEVQCPWALKSVRLDQSPAFKVTLKTADDSLARQRWGIVHAQIEEILERATRDAHAASGPVFQPADDERKSLAREQIATIAGQVKYDLLAEHDEAIIAGRAFAPVATKEGRAEMVKRAQTRVADKLWDFGDVDVARVDYVLNPRMKAPFVTEIRSDEYVGETTRRLRENGIEVPVSGDSRDHLALATTWAKLEALRAIEEREQGIAAHVMSERPQMPKVVAAKATVKLSDMHKRWINETKPKDKVARDVEIYLGYFTKKFGDLPVTEITRDILIAYREMMGRFPKSRPQRLQNGHPDAIVAWGEANPSTLKLSKRTINHKALAPVIKLMDLAVAHGFIPGSPCIDIKLKGVKKDAIKIVHFDEPDLKRFVASPVFSDSEFRPLGGAGQAAFWIPLIALFSGARLEEIGQLRVADIKRSDDGIDYFDITTLEDDPGDKIEEFDHIPKKSLKSEAATRQIPIHSMLIKMGFLDYVNGLSKNFRRMLFPELEAYRGRMTKNFSRWWGRYQDKHIGKSPTKVFHSFRHTFNRVLRDQGVPLENRKILMGHAGGEVNANYGEGLSLKPMQGFIEKIEFPGINFANLKWR